MVHLSPMLYRYRNGIANGVAPLAIVSTSGIIEEVNDRFVQLFGYERDEITGEHTRILRSGGTSPETYKGLWASVTAGRPWQGEVQNRKKDGTRVWVSSSISPVDPDASGEIEAFIVVYHDIEHLKQAQRLQREADVAAAKEDVLRGTIHNISNVQVLLQGAHATEISLVQGLIQSAEVAAKHLDSLPPEQVKAFMLGAMDVIKLTAGQILTASEKTQKGVQEINAVIQSCRQQIHNSRPIIERIRIREFLDDILSPVLPEMNKNGIAIAYNSMPEEDFAEWEVNNVRQIVHNLVKNAKEQIIEKQIPCGRVWIDVEEQSGSFEVSVTDNAGGFPGGVEGQLFRQGYTTKEKGSGVGLHNSANLARRMGGKLAAAQVNNPPGARFTLTLPAACAAA